MHLLARSRLLFATFFLLSLSSQVAHAWPHLHRGKPKSVELSKAIAAAQQLVAATLTFMV